MIKVQINRNLQKLLILLVQYTWLWPEFLTNSVLNALRKLACCFSISVSQCPKVLSGLSQRIARRVKIRCLLVKKFFLLDQEFIVEYNIIIAMNIILL